MKIYLTQQVSIVGDRWPHNWHKEYNSDIIPNIGMSIEDPLWKDPGAYKVLDVTINYYENYCYVELGKYEDEIPNERKGEFAHMANLHGWECSWAKLKV